MERVVRAVIGTGLVMLLGVSLGQVWGWVLGLVLLVTAIAGWCPIRRLLKKKERKATSWRRHRRGSWRFH